MSFLLLIVEDKIIKPIKLSGCFFFRFLTNTIFYKSSTYVFIPCVGAPISDMIEKSHKCPVNMSKSRNKRKKHDIQSYMGEVVNPTDRLPINCKESVRKHINSVYVGSILRIYDTAYGAEGHLVTAHWITNNGIFATLHEDCRMDFVTLKYKTWVVDQRMVRPGSFRLFTRFGTDDIEDENKTSTINETKQKNSRILKNDTLMDYPTQADQQTYRCSLFRLTCN